MRSTAKHYVKHRNEIPYPSMGMDISLNQPARRLTLPDISLLGAERTGKAPSS